MRYLLLFFLIFQLIFPPNISAQEPSIKLGPCGTAAPSNRFDNLCNSSTYNNVDTFIQNGIVAALVIACVLSLFFLIWGGVKWTVSGGDKAKVDTARATIIAAIVGLILTLLSYFILSSVLGLFGFGFNDLKIPKLYQRVSTNCEDVGPNQPCT